MYDIEMHEVSDDFAHCWHSAACHLNNMAQGPIQSWLKINLIPPFLEHISFRLGNQLFFIRIVDIDDQIQAPGNPTGVLTIAEGCQGFACLMPMRRRAGVWVPDEPNWGLLDARSGNPIDPVVLITDEHIEMTDWELQDFAVQIVRDYIKCELKCQLMSTQGNPDVDPSIWFVGDNGPEWVIVRSARYPEKEAARPPHIKEISERCSHLGNIGHFGSVAVANAEDDSDPTGDVQSSLLWRGHCMRVHFEGLMPTNIH
jgi:hypothetical protein